MEGWCEWERGKRDVDGERAMMGRSRNEGRGERCYVYTLMGRGRM